MCCFTTKDTGTLVGNIEPLYGEEDKLGPRQHLSHPIQPICFHSTDKLLSRCLSSNIKESILK